MKVLLTAACSALLVCVGAAPVVFAQQADDYLRPATAEGADLPEGLNQAVFASGCFWCTESDFEKLEGVIEVVSGFTGGQEPNPDYYAVARSRTGHTEAARIIYDPDIISYAALLDHYWRNVDPFDDEGQFCDRGTGYAPAIFTVSADQADQAEASRQRVQAQFQSQPVLVPIRELTTFWPAGVEHQDYYETNPIRYQRYRFGCRRDARLRQIWGETN